MRIALVACGGSHTDAVPGLDPRPAPEAGPAGPRAAGGGRITSLAQALARLGHRVTVYVRKDCRDLPSSLILCPGASIEYVSAGGPVPMDADALTAHVPEFASCLARRWRQNPPDVVDAHFWTSGLAALAGARGLDVPVAQTFTSLRAAEERYGAAAPRSNVARRRLEAAVARAADMLLATSAQEASDLARLGTPRARIRVVPCGVDTVRFTPEGPAVKRGSRPRLLAAQPLTAVGDLVVALRALAEIPDAELVVTGGPGKASLSRHPAYRAIKQAARNMGVDGRLVFTGQIRPADLPALLRSADLLLSTARYEPVGMRALQAMACGTPVVACAAGAEQDAVVDMTTGLHALTDRPAELARQVRQLLASPVRLEAYSIAAADRARSRYCWDRVARETAAAYDSVRRRPEAAAADRDGQADETGGAVVAALRARHVPAGGQA
jgi:glycosyltransferase involved in cell wall biosynthesis